MRTIVKGFVIAVFAAAILALVTATPSEAAKRQVIEIIDECTSKSTNKGCEGAICYCCVSDSSGKGCYICNEHWSECVWESGHPGLKSRGVTRPGQGGVLQQLEKAPQGGVKPTPVTPGLKQR